MWEKLEMPEWDLMPGYRLDYPYEASHRGYGRMVGPWRRVSIPCDAWEIVAVELPDGRWLVRMEKNGVGYSTPVGEPKHLVRAEMTRLYRIYEPTQKFDGLALIPAEFK